MIDADERTYSIEMLRTWRKVAELRADLSHREGRQITFDENRSLDLSLAEETLELISNPPDLARRIGDMVRLCCVSEIWGKDVAHAIRDLLIESALNAFEHGGATKVDVHIKPSRIVLTDDGCPFDVLSLETQEGRGGSRCVRHLVRTYPQALVATHRSDGENHLVVGRVTDAKTVLSFSPCVAELERYSHQGINDVLDENLEHDCSTMFIVLPPYFHPSKAIRLRNEAMLDHRNRRIVFLGRHISPLTIEGLKDDFPRSSFVELEPISGFDVP